jgi:glycosyltransferase involved in cell wall biosynthesis
MPVYRADTPERVRRAAESSTVEQQRRPAELVLVRDGPVPAPLEAELERLSRELPVPVVRVDLERNAGLTAALTAGLARCRYDVVARMDADDVSYPRRFAVQLPLIEAGADLVGASMHEIGDDETRPLAVRHAPVGRDEILAVSRRRNPLSHPSVVFRRRAVEAAGGYVDVPLGEDYWLWVRMLRAGADVRNVADPLVGYRVSTGAYERRGGLRMFRADLRLQRLMRGIGHIGFLQWAVNVLLRAGYRFVPTGLRERTYRAMVGTPRR